jgi:hypothetical protein
LAVDVVFGVVDPFAIDIYTDQSDRDRVGVPAGGSLLTGMDEASKGEKIVTGSEMA